MGRGRIIYMGGAERGCPPRADDDRGKRDGLVLFNGALQSGDRIIVEGVQKVREGQRVELVARNAPPAQQAVVRAAGQGK